MAQATKRRPGADAPVVHGRQSANTPWPLKFYGTAVGKKWVMAISGILLMGFVFAHMIGNLKMYLGAEQLNHYAESLRTLLYPIMPKEYVLWGMRIGLLFALFIHLHAAISLTAMNRKARPVSYQSKRDYIAANFASRSMRWTGIIVFFYILFHLADLTSGRANPDFREGEVYHNVLASFDRPLVAIFYIIANALLAIHLYHGAWSIFQSLGINSPKYNAARRWFAIGFATIIGVVNISFPIAVMTGMVK